ncbi:hypothetical protein BC831DRAFT_462989 [Entophlyctis helioformis]|nr:hypothetical protein BC831DRAFT_462989 [Entophlyctis helioformis]
MLRALHGASAGRAGGSTSAGASAAAGAAAVDTADTADAADATALQLRLQLRLRPPSQLRLRHLAASTAMAATAAPTRAATLFSQRHPRQLQLQAAQSPHAPLARLHRPHLLQHPLLAHTSSRSLFISPPPPSLDASPSPSFKWKALPPDWPRWLSTSPAVSTASTPPAAAPPQAPKDALTAKELKGSDADPAKDDEVSVATAAYVPKHAYLGEWKSRVRQMRRDVTEVEIKNQRKEVMEGSQKVVALAITSNLIMFMGKLYGAMQSGSASMFSEALHSLADVLNESLLMWGLWRSLRRPDSDHPYGFASERYAWALVSGVGVFFLGGGVSLYHGISGLLSTTGHVVGDPTTSLFVLGASLTFELVTMTFAFRQISRSAQAAGKPFMDYLRRGGDPTSVQVFLEDCAAVTGVVIAATCLSLSKYLALPFLDSLGSLLIGLLLSAVATFLIRRNIAGLVETSMNIQTEGHIVELLENDPVVVSVHDVKSTSLGPEWARFKAEILFNGEEVTRRYMAANPGRIDKEIAILRGLTTDDEIRAWMAVHGAHVVTSLGGEVDRLEGDIKAFHPEVKHIDLEIL